MGANGRQTPGSAQGGTAEYRSLQPHVAQDFRHDVVGIESDEGFSSSDRTPDGAHRNYSNATVLQAGRAPLFRYANRIVLMRRQYRNLCHVSNRPG